MQGAKMLHRAPAVRHRCLSTATGNAKASGGGCGGHGHSHQSPNSYGGRSIPKPDAKLAPPGAPTKSYDMATLRSIVRRGDYEGFLCGLFMPSASHEAYYALRAFNIELATIRDSARGNTQAAHVRMAFWRDLIEAAYSGGSNPHPLFKPLAGAIAQHGLSRQWLDRIIDARDSDVSGAPPATLSDLEAYAEDTAGSLLRLTVEACGVRSSGSAGSSEGASSAAARHVGTAAGLANVLRALPVHGRLGQRYLPTDVMARHGLAERDLVILDSDVRGDDGRSLEELGLASKSASSDGAPKPRAPLFSATTDSGSQAAEREALRQAALRRLAGSVSAARSGGTLSDLSSSRLDGSLPPPPSRSDSINAAAQSKSSSPSAGSPSRAATTAADLDEPRTLRMAGSRATAASPSAGRGGGGVDRVMVVGRDAPAASSSAQSGVGGGGRGSAPAFLDEVSPDGRTGEMGGFASTDNRMGAIAAARAAQAQAKAEAQSASTTSSGGSDGSHASATASGIRIEHAAAPKLAGAQAESSPSPQPSPAAASAATGAGSLFRSLLGGGGGGGPSVRLVLAKDASTLAAIRHAVADVAGAAQAHLDAARALQGTLPHEAVPALLPAVPVGRFLARLRAQDHDIFAAGPAGPWRDTRALARLYLQLDLLRNTLRGTY